MGRYHEIANDLRGRIQAGEFPLGSQLPGITDLQQHYGGVSLGTIRAAQQHLVEEGMLRTRQGSGAFVTATESRRDLDVDAALAGAHETLGVALAALRARSSRSVTFDLSGDDDTYFVLTTALEDFAARERMLAQDDPDDDFRTRWAAVADELRAQVEAGLERSAPTDATTQDAR